MAYLTEEELLDRLNGLYAQRSLLENNLAEVNEQVEAMEVDLRGLREEIMTRFLHEELDPKLISFNLHTSGNDLLVSLNPQVGGEVEYTLMTDSINWGDFKNLPVILLLAYLGKGMPWRSTGAFI